MHSPSHVRMMPNPPCNNRAHSPEQNTHALAPSGPGPWSSKRVISNHCATPYPCSDSPCHLTFPRIYIASSRQRTCSLNHPKFGRRREEQGRRNGRSETWYGGRFRGRRYAAVTHWWNWYRGNECDGTSRQNGEVLGVFWQKASEGRVELLLSCELDFLLRGYTTFFDDDTLVY
jgi:hypothetical protein